MKALDRKVLRDLGRMRGQALTIALVVACGIAAWLASNSAWRSLTYSRDTYYRQAHFADVFARLERAPRSLLEQVRRIPGLAEVDDRVVAEGRLEVPGFDEPVRGQLISVNLGEERAMNALTVTHGRAIEAAGEVLVSAGFAEAHQLQPGAELVAVVGGRRAHLRVVGVALSPEYVFIFPPGALFADPRRFGVLWVERRSLEALSRMEGAFNDLVARLAPGAALDPVLDALDRLLERYGSAGAYGRERQSSNRFLSQEIRQLEGMARLLPVIFLGVAAFLLNVLLARIIGIQREQIAALKALGYSNRQVAAHYLKLALVIVAAGSILGILLGAWAADGMVGLYTEFFRFPVLSLRLEPKEIASAIGISTAAGVLGTLGAVRSAVKLSPAEAMRPEAPPSFHRMLSARFHVDRWFPTPARMVLRDLESHALRTLLSSLAIAFATAVLVVGNVGYDSIDSLFRTQFDRAQREDLEISFLRPLPRRSLHTLARLPGVFAAEPLRLVPVRLRGPKTSREAALIGLEVNPELRRLLDTAGQEIVPPESGLLLSRTLGGILQVTAGDGVEVESLEGGRLRRRVVVSGLVDDLVGLSAYMRPEAIARLFRQAPLVNSVMLSVDRAQLDALIHRLGAFPNVTAISRREQGRDQFRSQTAKSFLTFQIILAAFASVIAVGVVYNNARIALAVRSRDLATLRILGLTRAEVGRLLVGEQAVQIILGVPVGLPLGRLLGRVAFSQIDPELFRLPITISARTQASAVILVALAGLLSAVLVRRRADHLDLVGVLKARD